MLINAGCPARTVRGIGRQSNLTPNVSLTYDQNNRLKTMADAAGNTTFTWSELGTLAAEDGPWVSDTISFGYNDTGLRQALTLVQPNASPWTQAYAYDGNWRLKELTSPSGGFTNTFLGASRRVTKLALANGSVVTDTYDDLGRLLSTVLTNSTGAVLNTHAYSYDAAHQRTNQTLAEGNFWQYGYDALGQLTGAQGREGGGVTNRLHEQLSYGYDAAGNLIGRTNNGFVQVFTLTNNFNQLDRVTRSGTFTAAGLVQSATNVTVTVKVNDETNGVSATMYADKSFARSGITLTNGNNTFTAVATDSNGRLATNEASAWLPATASFVHDKNGNLTSDGRRGFGYDDFDQLTSVTVTNAWRSEFKYDALGRRRVRTEKVWKNSQWVTASETRYVYDHMLVIQERDALNLPTATYTRGLDLSGGLQRAGGIGGLLALTLHSSLPTPHFFYHADAGGNVTALTDARQAVVARYRYDPFGNLLGLSGPMAEANLYRFSSKEWHANSGLYYYGYRFYEPSLQRWVNRDPIAELGGINLYGFVGNGPLNTVDPLGLAQPQICGFEYDPRNGGKVTVRCAVACEDQPLEDFYFRLLAEHPPPPPEWMPDHGVIVNDLAILNVLAAPRLAAGLTAGARDPCFRAAAKTTPQTSEILDGVRRVKAADLVGNPAIPAQILNAEGKVVGTQNLPVSQVLSPKPCIDVRSTVNMDRFMNILNQTKAGSVPPPILVQPGSGGIPIRNVPLDPLGPG